MLARHPGVSFPVHHPQEAVPKLTNGNPPLLALVLPLFKTHISRGLAGDTIFPCVPGLDMQIHNDVLLDMPQLLQGSNRLVLLLSFIVKVAQFALISFYF